MKAITLRHPWAFCIAHWGKRIENRNWLPPVSLLGQRIAIHGGKSPRSNGGYRLEAARQFAELYERFGCPPAFAETTTYRELMAMSWTPGIVATAVLSHTVGVSDDPWRDDSKYGWVLIDVITLDDPIAIGGAQGLWDVPSEIVQVLASRGAA